MPTYNIAREYRNIPSTNPIAKHSTSKYAHTAFQCLIIYFPLSKTYL